MSPLTRLPLQWHQYDWRGRLNLVPPLSQPCPAVQCLRLGAWDESAGCGEKDKPVSWEREYAELADLLESMIKSVFRHSRDEDLHARSIKVNQRHNIKVTIRFWGVEDNEFVGELVFECVLFRVFPPCHEWQTTRWMEIIVRFFGSQV
jgi:hypothetical protein